MRMEPKMKLFYPKVKAVDTENRRITVCISKDEIDRHNERIEIEAIADALKLYSTNPVVLGDHQHRLSTGQSSVIGHSPQESFKVYENEVDLDIVFSVTENAETYWINYRDGHQRAVSIGFIDLEWKFEEEDGKKIFVTTKLELLEVSCVAVGANRGALIKAKGMFDRINELAPKNPNEDKDSKLETVLTSSDPTKIREEIKPVLESIVETLDEIKSLLIAESGNLAEGWLGGHSEQVSSGGDQINAEQSLERIEQSFNLGGSQNVD